MCVEEKPVLETDREKIPVSAVTFGNTGAAIDIRQTARLECT